MQLAFIGVKKEVYDNCIEDIKKDLEAFENALLELEYSDFSEDKKEQLSDELEEAIQELEEYV